MTSSDRSGLDRRSFLGASGLLTATGALSSLVGCSQDGPEAVSFTGGASRALPFALDRVRLGPGIFQQKRDRMLQYARSYGGSDPFAGPDRLLSIFRANAGLDTRGARPVGSWENATGYLRGHYAGHFLTMLAQAWAATGEEIFRRKLDYMVTGLAECQTALAAAAERATPRIEGHSGGGALHLSGSPLGLAEHVRLPSGIVRDCRDFTVACWIKPYLYNEYALPDRPQTPEEIADESAVFDFGAPNPEYAEAPLVTMSLVVRHSSEEPGPRFSITNSGADGEQVLQAREPLPIGQWSHVAVTGSGGTATLWVDGEAVARGDVSVSPADLGPTPDNWIGRRQFPQRTISYLHADLDDFVILSSALDRDGLRSLLESGDTPAGVDAVARYGFDEAEGPTATDSSGNERHATVVAPTDGRRHPGFLSAYPETQFVRLEEFATYGPRSGIWAPYYTLHKIMAGLLDAHAVAGNEQALEVVTGIGDWVTQRLLSLEQPQLDRMWDLYIAGEYGGINESLANLHALHPGKDEYLEASRSFVNNNVYVPTAAGEDALDGRHANQHIPQFLGYLRTWEEGGHDDSFYEASRNFWEMVAEHRTYSHGGTGVGEMLRARDVIAGSLYDDENHAETCPLYNMLKLSRQLFFHDPDPKYMNYFELGLFNQMLASRRDVDSSESPEVTYFVPVRPGSRRRYDNVGTCCGGTGMESHTKAQDSIYFRSADSSTLWVNLYIASTLDWADKGFAVSLETDFPHEGRALLTVDGSGPLDLRLRVPVWVGRDFAVKVNGEAQRVDAEPGTYLSLSRDWSPSDRVEVEMPLRFRIERAIDDASVQSVYYGPTLLAAQAKPIGEDLETGLLEISLYRHVGLDGDVGAAFEAVRGAKGEVLHFRTGDLVLVPFHRADPSPEIATSSSGEGEDGDSRRFEPTEPYHLYLRRREPEIAFGAVSSGVANPVGEDGLSWLDRLWAEAPFEDHGGFVAAAERLTGEALEEGLLASGDVAAVVDAARQWRV